MDDLATLTRLLEDGVDADDANSAGQTALMEAAAYGKLFCLDELIANDASLDARCQNKRTALHYSAMCGNASCAASLLKAGADRSLKDFWGKTALDCAKHKNHTEVVCVFDKFIAAHEADLRKAARMGDIHTLTRLLEDGVDKDAANTAGQTALIEAAAFGKLHCLDQLIFKGANVDAQCQRKCTALHAAVENDEAPCAALLLKAGADLSLKDYWGKTALDWARHKKHTKVVCVFDNFIAAQAKAAEEKAAPTSAAAAELAEKKAKEDLRSAAMEGDLATLTRLLEEGVDKDAATSGGGTSLMYAAMYGKLDCLDLLIAKGASLDAQSTKTKWTALHLAANYGKAPCAESLLKAGADTSLKDKGGNAALDCAKNCGHEEVVRVLENAFAAQAA